jgi:hypothetical protein
MAHGTATITHNEALGIYTLRFKTLTRDFIGQQLFGNSNDGFRAALRFCRERNLQVMECSL